MYRAIKIAYERGPRPRPSLDHAGVGHRRPEGCRRAARAHPALGRALPRWPLLAAVWGGAVLLTAYGGLFTLGGVLVVTGVIPASGTAD